MYLQVLNAHLRLFNISDLDISIESPSPWWLFCLDDSRILQLLQVYQPDIPGFYRYVSQKRKVKETIPS